MPLKLFGAVLAISTFACGSPAWAQEQGRLDPKPLPPSPIPPIRSCRLRKSSGAR